MIVSHRRDLALTDVTDVNYKCLHEKYKILPDYRFTASDAETDAPPIITCQVKAYHDFAGPWE